MSKTKKDPVSAPQNSVYKTDEGEKLNLLEDDPKYRKPAKKETPKVTQIKIKQKYSEPVGTWKRFRPLIGIVLSPYLVVRPIIRLLSWLGNRLFERIFYPQ